MEEVTNDKPTTSGGSSAEVSIPITKPPTRMSTATPTKKADQTNRYPSRFRPWLVALFSAVLLAGGWGTYQHLRQAPTDDEDLEFAELEGFEELDSKLGVATADGTVPVADDHEGLADSGMQRNSHHDGTRSSGFPTGRQSNSYLGDDRGLVVGNGGSAAWLSGTIELDEGEAPGSRPATRLSGGALDGPILR